MDVFIYEGCTQQLFSVAVVHVGSQLWHYISTTDGFHIAIRLGHAFSFDPSFASFVAL